MDFSGKPKMAVFENLKNAPPLSQKNGRFIFLQKTKVPLQNYSGTLFFYRFSLYLIGTKTATISVNGEKDPFVNSAIT